MGHVPFTVEQGFRLTERYRLIERLDGGGALEVWLARDELLCRPVVVKLLTASRSDMQAVFQKGVNRAAGLSHPALEKVYDSDQTRDASGRLVSFVVTEFLDGTPLPEELARGPLTAPEIADMCAQIAAALATAHAAGVAHGDLKPNKILLTSEDVKLVDIGIGAVVRSARGTAGSEAALPLQKDLDEVKAADVQALGGIMAACLSGGPSSSGLASLAADCLAADPALRPSAMRVASILSPPAEAPDVVLFAVAPQPSPTSDGRTRTPCPPEPRKRRDKGMRLAAAAVAIAIPVTAVVTALASSPREPLPVAQPQPTRSRPASTPTPAPPPAPTASSPPGGVSTALSRLRPIVNRGFAAGEIRSDVALDLDNVITNLENDLLAHRLIDVPERLAQLRDKILTRLRERSLSHDLADQMTGVLSAVTL